MIRPLSRSPRSKYGSWVVYYGLVLYVGLLLVQIQASPDALYTDKSVKLDACVVSSAQENQQTRQLELNKPIERELGGGQSHLYQMTLAAGQYVKLVVEQRGIDVAAKLFAMDGRQITEFDSESRTHGQEVVEWVAEEAGSYQVDLQARYKNTAGGRYEIRVAELRLATEHDHALHEASKLYLQFRRLYFAGKYDEARPLVERMLDIRERVLGAEHLDVGAAINSLASIYFSKGLYATAEPLYQRALAIGEKVLGPEHPLVARYLTNLANNSYYTSDYAKAEQYYRRALTIFEKALGPEHSDVSAAVVSLAALYRDRGDYANAEPLYQRALNIREKALGPAHPLFAASLNNLALLYLNRGDYEKAEKLYQRAVAINEKALGPEHPDFALSLNNLAITYHKRGDYAKAEPLWQRALTIREKALGPEHHYVGSTLHNLATLYSKRGDYEKAEPLYQRALAIRVKALRPEHPDIALSIGDLANIYRKRGDNSKAEPLYQRTLAILEKSLGPKHTLLAEPLNHLAVLYAAKGDIAQAVTFMSRALAVAEHNFARTLAIGSERQKLAYLALFFEQIDFTFSLHSQAATNDPQALDLAFTTLLRRKGRGLDAMIDTIATLRRHATAKDQELFNRLADARSRLATLTLKEPGAINLDTYRAQLQQIEDEIDKREVELSSRSIEFRRQAQPITLGAVQAALPSGSALVEFSIFTPLDPRTDKSKAPRYLAYVLAAQEAPKWVDIGEAGPIDRAVDAWRKVLRNPNRADVKRLARAVDEKVMRPVRSILDQLPGDTRRLLIAPDGPLNLIPFAALVDERNRYLVEHYSISYLTSGRDLLRLQTSQPSKSAPLVVANPLFGTGETAATSLAQISAISPAGDQADNQGPAQTDAREVLFQALPGTRREALAIKAVLPEASLLLREEATESALKQTQAPSILHIATHGFFLEDQQAPAPDTRGLSTLRISDPRLMKWAGKIENPLLRSGLALAGVNQRRSSNDDGLLTALETASLDLWGTKLVVLSACDTGVGKVKNGEGVYGLRRALVLAGSQTQVMSLWPVLDRETRGLMAGYYRRLQKGEGRGEALRQIQLEMLKDAKLRHPYYWASFIQAGEWANLDGKR
jgi:CHAT domain-containing protein/tetratricopeptide (TPR) repeat protein